LIFIWVFFFVVVLISFWMIVVWIFLRSFMTLACLFAVLFCVFVVISPVFSWLFNCSSCISVSSPHLWCLHHFLVLCCLFVLYCVHCACLCVSFWSFCMSSLFVTALHLIFYSFCHFASVAGCLIDIPTTNVITLNWGPGL